MYVREYPTQYVKVLVWCPRLACHDGCMNITNRTYIVHSDPGHAWLAVPFKVLSYCGLADKISRYSYVHGQTVYLEEDCDAGVFVECYQRMYGEKPKMRVSHTNGQSRVRAYNSYEFRKM